MRVMVFRDGLSGEMVNLVGEYPMEEIGEVLGGRADEEMIQLSRRLAVVVRADRGSLPPRYEIAYLGQRMTVRGDCVVVRRMMGGERIRDMTAKDGDDARRFVEAIRGPRESDPQLSWGEEAERRGRISGGSRMELSGVSADEVVG